MPKVDASAFARPQPGRFRRVIADPSNPGLEIVIEGRKLRKLEVSSATAYASDVYADHMTGAGIPDKPGYVAPDFLLLDGEPVFFDIQAAQVACILFRCQTVGEADRYTPQDIIRLMAVDGLNEGIQEAAMFAMMPEEVPKADPLAGMGCDAPSSATASTEAPDTPTSPTA